MDSIFSVGDRIRVKENGFEGTINIVIFDVYCISYVYDLVWDAYPGQGPFRYLESDVELLWEKIAPTYSYAFSHVATSYAPVAGETTVPIDTGTGKSGCSHTWLKYQGFNDSFEYCKHCDVKR